MSEKFVCIECVEEPYLAGLVVQNAEAIECSFCEEQVEDGGSPIAASYDFLFEVVRAAVHREFQNPDDAGLPYDSEEGGYLGQVFNTSEIISELDASLWDEPNPFWENVIEDLGEYEIWCFRDPFSLKTGEILRNSWHRFQKIIMHETRYFFVNVQIPERDDPSYFIEEFGPLETLGHIAACCEELGLYRQLEDESLVYRARRWMSVDGLKSPLDIGPPRPMDTRQSNRMNPPGIPMFYGALDGRTALCEAFTQLGRYLIGEFRVKKPVTVLDLCQLPPVPSIFNSEMASIRDKVIFMHEFKKEISREVERDGRDHIEYVPTQVVTEFFRTSVKLAPDDTVMGILYPSVKNPDGINAVLFATADNVEHERKPTKKIARWQIPSDDSSEMWLRLQSHEIKEIRARDVINS